MHTHSHVSENKPPLKRGKVGSHFLMRETQRGIVAVPLLSGGLFEYILALLGSSLSAES